MTKIPDELATSLWDALSGNSGGFNLGSIPIVAPHATQPTAKPAPDPSAAHAALLAPDAPVAKAATAPPAEPTEKPEPPYAATERLLALNARKAQLLTEQMRELEKRIEKKRKRR